MGGAPARRAPTPVGAHICHGVASSLLCVYTLLTGAAAHTWQCTAQRPLRDVQTCANMLDTQCLGGDAASRHRLK